MRCREIFSAWRRPDRYSFSADAVDFVSVCRLSREAFTHFIGQRPQFLLRINEFAARELMLAQEQMLLLGRRRTRGG